MPTDPITVEVVCPFCRLVDGADGPIFRPGFCNFCIGTRKQRHPLAPTSLAAAEIALARAVDREQQAHRQYLLHGEHEQVAKAWDAATEAVAAALAALRAHPEYRVCP